MGSLQVGEVRRGRDCVGAWAGLEPVTRRLSSLEGHRLWSLETQLGGCLAGRGCWMEYRCGDTGNSLRKPQGGASTEDRQAWVKLRFGVTGAMGVCIWEPTGHQGQDPKTAEGTVWGALGHCCHCPEQEY